MQYIKGEQVANTTTGGDARICVSPIFLETDVEKQKAPARFTTAGKRCVMNPRKNHGTPQLLRSAKVGIYIQKHIIEKPKWQKKKKKNDFQCFTNKKKSLASPLPRLKTQKKSATKQKSHRKKIS